MVKINAYSLHFLICLVVSIVLSQNCAAMQRVQGEVATMRASENRAPSFSWAKAWSMFWNELNEAADMPTASYKGPGSTSQPIPTAQKQAAPVKKDQEKDSKSKNVRYEFSDEEESSEDSPSGSPIATKLLAIEYKKDKKAKKD